MALANKISLSTNILGLVYKTQSLSRSFSTGHVLCRVGLWRQKNNIPAKGNEYGPLADLPDWSYADGRPAPLTVACKRKIKLHKEYCEQIIKLTKEVDECFELNEEKAAMEKEKRENFIRNQLKPKTKPLKLKL